MPKNHPIAPFDKSDPRVLDQLAKIQLVCIGVVALIAIVTLSAWVLTDLGILLPVGWTLMKANTATLALAGATSLMLSRSRRSSDTLIISKLLAVFVTAIAAISLTERAFRISVGVDTLIAPDPFSPSHHPGLMSPQSGSAFLLLGIVLFFLRSRTGVARYIADIALFALSFLVLVVVSGYLFGATSPFSIAQSNWTSPQALLSILLLTFAAFGRRAEHGVFSILVGSGEGSKIARILAPFLLLLPFVREFVRSRVIQNSLLPVHYTSAILATFAALVGVVLLMLLALRINSMENQIQMMSLRDELTGLCNLRGFRVLAEHGLLEAKRSQVPFSVLFVDVDNLKQVNDKLGHRAGSDFLVETAELLKSTFRESDVVGRVGGDEFAVSGAFSSRAIAIAADRLHTNLEMRKSHVKEQMRLSLSIGFVTTGEKGNETLEDLLAKADEAMYEQKRLKKMSVRST
jgi:diguanylate cyclase (GGDEF)-like protein